jgi:hypothetical protein
MMDGCVSDRTGPPGVRKATAWPTEYTKPGIDDIGPQGFCVRTTKGLAARRDMKHKCLLCT